jgi:hypothetical protein
MLVDKAKMAPIVSTQHTSARKERRKLVASKQAQRPYVEGSLQNIQVLRERKVKEQESMVDYPSIAVSSDNELPVSPTFAKQEANNRPTTSH